MENWSNELPFVAITVCDKDGKILDMNNRSQMTFAKSGGKDLIGKSLFDCHPQRAQEMIKHLMNSESTNTYTIEKEGVKKLIYQTPWYQDGQFAGLVEMSIVIPNDIPHYKR